MDNFDLRKYLVENKVTTNSRMMKEYFEGSSESVAEAFTKAGIDLAKPVYVVETGGGPGGSFEQPTQMLGKRAAALLEKERRKAEQDEAAVTFDYSAGGYSPEHLDVPANFKGKLAMMVEDAYEFVVFQAGNSKMMKEYFEGSSESVAEAFTKAGIDMNKPVEVVEAGGGPGGSMEEPRKMNPKVVVAMLEKEKAEFEAGEDGDAVTYDFNAEESYPGAKLAIMFSDAYEYIIFQ